MIFALCPFTLFSRPREARPRFFLIRQYDTVNRPTVLSVERKDGDAEWPRRAEGHYLLRTSITDWAPLRVHSRFVNSLDE